MTQPFRPYEIDKQYKMLEHSRMKGRDLDSAKSRIFDNFKDYFDKKWESEKFNRDNFLGLWKIFSWDAYKEKKKEIEAKLIEFKNAIEGQESPYVALRIDFKLYPLKELKPHEEVNWND